MGDSLLVTIYYTIPSKYTLSLDLDLDPYAAFD